jgi:mRNA interferase MazF
MKRGEVYIADLVPRSGSEQTGRRPVILVSHDGFNRTPGWRSIIVVPISTSASQGKRGITVIEIPGGAAGLTKNSFAICHQVTTLDRAKLTKRLGALPPEILREVEWALAAAMDLDLDGPPASSSAPPSLAPFH